MTQDRATVLAGIPNELEAFAELVGSLSSTELLTATRCDGWTVAHVAGHVIGTIVDVTQGRLEGQGTPEVTERQAKERAGRSAQELADELRGAAPTLTALLASLPEEAWDAPSPAAPEYTLGFAVEAMWYDAYLHGDDIRAALGRPSTRGPGLLAAVHHVAGYLEHRGGPSLTLALDGVEPVAVGGGGAEVIGDPLAFVLAATGRADPATVGLDPDINVYG